MKMQAILLISALLFAAQAAAEIKTPSIPAVEGSGDRQTTLLDVNNPEVGEGSTPDGASADQTFKYVASDGSVFVPVTAGADNGKPELSVDGIGRKMLSGRKMLGDLSLTGNGVSAGEDGDGVTTTLAGQGSSDADKLDLTDTATHIQPHQDTTTVTADGKSVTAGGGANPDQLGGEGDDALVYTEGRK